MQECSGAFQRPGAIYSQPSHCRYSLRRPTMVTKGSGIVLKNISVHLNGRLHVEWSGREPKPVSASAPDGVVWPGHCRVFEFLDAIASGLTCHKNPGAPILARNILTIATVLEMVHDSCCETGDMLVRIAMGLDNTHAAAMADIVIDSERHFVASIVEDHRCEGGAYSEGKAGALNRLTEKVAAPGMVATEYLMRGLAGAMLPFTSLAASMSHQLGKAKEKELNLPADSYLPFRNRATQNIHPTLLGLLNHIATTTVNEWMGYMIYPGLVKHFWGMCDEMLGVSMQALPRSGAFFLMQ